MYSEEETLYFHAQLSPKTMTINKRFTLFILPVLLSACTLIEVTPDDNTVDTPAQVQEEETLKDILQEQPIRETNNVTYSGVVQPAGISIYQQGSHRLSLPGGKFILLEADDIDLNGYVGEEVTIFGSLRPTVEVGGMIMRVERIELVIPKEEEPIEDTNSEPDNLPIDSETEDKEMEEKEEKEEEKQEGAQEKSSDESSSSSESSSSESSASEVSSESVEVSAEFTERVDVMSRQDYSPENWTQQYCSSHIGFCSPVHRNWWFKSFGTTNEELWHVELSSAPIDAMGQGPISVDLIAGDIPVSTGTVNESNGKVMGYSEWTFGRHFVISADSSLRAAVEYITQNITEYVQ